MAPAMRPAQRNSSNAPKLVIDSRTIAARPAAGPETLIFEVLKNPMTIPPTIPEITPESGGAPDARAIPKHSGSAHEKDHQIPEAKILI